MNSYVTLGPVGMMDVMPFRDCMACSEQCDRLIDSSVSPTIL